MRCINCKKRISSNSKFCPSCGNVVSAERKKGNRRFRLICLIVLIIGSLISFIFSTNSVRKTALALSEIQSNLTDITSAKLAGNSVVAGKKVTTAYQNIANLSVPSLLQDYQRVAVIWGNKISAAANNTKTWKNLSNQPGDFPLILSDNQAQTFFRSSIKTIAELKQNGADAIKNKDPEAMRLIASKLLAQKHWLNGILYSKKNDTASFNLITSVFASNQDPMPVPAIGTTEDVTCRLCSDPGIRWTEKLRSQYGCDVGCKPQQAQEQNGQAQQQQTQNNQNKNNSNNSSADDIEKLESYTYKDSPKRAICIGNNIGGVFCVEDAVQSTNEIAASAIGFANGAKILSVDQWNKKYKNIGDTFSADGTIGAPVSNPSAAGGHLEGGMGVVSTGKPDQPPKPKKSTPNSNNFGNPPPVMKPIDPIGSGQGGLSTPPNVDLDRDTSAEQSR